LVGNGQATKLCNQTIAATSLVAIAEAIALARNNGLDPLRLPQPLEGGWADSKLLQMFVPRMVSSPTTIIGTIKTMLKDLDAVCDLARQSGTAVPVASASQQLFRIAESLGLGAADISCISRMLDRIPVFN
jgi:2-hydroxy-3-oxopropionate reductase